MNSIWNNNIKVFKERFPSLAEVYSLALDTPPSDSEISTIWQITQAKNGALTASENGKRLHSAYNPEREALQAVTEAERSNKSTTVFYGFGLGYHVIEWAKLNCNSEKKLILIEPDFFRFFSALALTDWTEVFKIKNLIIAIACPESQILPLIEDSSKINICNSGVSDAFFFDIPTFTEHAKDYFENVKAIILRNKKKNEINAATLKKFGKLWCKNSIKNIDFMKDCSPILEYKDCLRNKNIPAIIIGAGPSLEKIIPHLEEIKKRSVIICVETALHTLLKAKIEPDFIILLDPQYWAYRHIAALKSPSSILITEISVYPPVFRFNCKKISICSSQFLIGQYFENQLNYYPGDLGTGGSVAASAWNFAKYLGTEEIYLAGIDLGFPGKQTHIKGSSAEQTFHRISVKTAPAEKSGISSLFSANATPAEDYNGNKVITDSRMKMFAWWFESKIAACPEVKTFTLCPEGLRIPGVIVAEKEGLLQKEDITEKKNEILSCSREERMSNLQLKQFKKLKEAFPTKDFLSNNEFLRDYL